VTQSCGVLLQYSMCMYTCTQFCCMWIWCSELEI